MPLRTICPFARAGTGLAGESLGAGLILDFSQFMRRIMEVGADFVRLQPGVVLAQLNRLLAEQGRLFGPDPFDAQRDDAWQRHRAGWLGESLAAVWFGSQSCPQTTTCVGRR